MPVPASRPTTSHRLPRAPLPVPPLRPDRGGGPRWATDQSERQEVPRPPASPAPRRHPPITPRGRPTGRPNRGRAEPPAPRPSRARQRLRGRPHGGLGILPAAPRSVGLGRPRRERGRQRSCSWGAGQRRRVRRAPPAGRKGASAPPGTAARDPGPKRRRRPCCLEPGRLPTGRGPWPDVPGPELPEAPPGERGPPRPPQRSRPPPGGALGLPGLTCAAAWHPGAGAWARRGRHPRPPAGRGRGRPRPSTLNRAARRLQSHRSARRAWSRGVSSPETAALGMLSASTAARAPPAIPALDSWTMPQCLHGR